MKGILMIAYAIIGLASPAQAGCTCQCVERADAPLCSSALDLPAICPPTVCHRLALDPTHQPAEHPANWDLAMPSGADLRPVRKLQLATGLPII